MFEPVGLVTVKKPVTKTDFFFGDISVIEGATLRVIEKNTNGDCLAIANGNLVDIDNEDVQTYIPLPKSDWDTLTSLISEMLSGKHMKT